MSLKPKSPERPAPGRATATGTRRIGVARMLSKLGIASRTVAARWVQAGRVAINGNIVRDPQTPVVKENDRIAVDGRLVCALAKRYVMLNKPRGVVTTARDEKGRATVYVCFKRDQDRRLAPVGRLDKASEGLLLFSNDSEWASRLLDPDTHLSRVYHVQIEGHVDNGRLDRMHKGVRVKDGAMLKVNEARILRSGAKNCWLEITIYEGKNRQIRRVMEALGLKVLRLLRVAIGPLRLGTLDKGGSRMLSEHELRQIEAALAVNKLRG